MDKYVVKLYTRAYQDLNDIYTYIAETLLEPGTALDMVDELEEAIFSLEQLPRWKLPSVICRKLLQYLPLDEEKGRSSYRYRLNI